MNHEQTFTNLIDDFNKCKRTSLVSKINQLLNSDALLGERWSKLAGIASRVGESGATIDAALRYANMNPGDIDRQVGVAGIMANEGRFHQSLEFIGPILAAFPQNPAVNHFVGTIKSQLGLFDEAKQHFQVTLSAWSNSGPTWLALCAMEKFTEQSPEREQMQAQLPAITAATPMSQATFHYALGKILFDLNDNAEAFTEFSKGAEIISKSQQYNVEKEKQYIEAILRNYAEDHLEALSESSDSGESPIFVMGWARSGTTLVEQIISSHRDVLGGGELDFINKATFELGGISYQHAKKFEDKFSSPAEAWNHLAKTYNHLINERFGQEGRIVDKTLNTTRYLGLALKMFPKARVIMLRRNPLDAAWSCFRTCFSGSMPWSWKLEDIAQHFMLENKLMDHWLSVFPDNIMLVPYEELVAEPDLWNKKITAHCGLSEQDLVNQFHLSDRAVVTSSSIQVRQAINCKAVGLAKEYDAFLEPFSALYK